MPYNQVLSKFKRGKLKSGSGHKVKDKAQALAIMLSEKKKSSESSHYAPSEKSKKKMGLK